LRANLSAGHGKGGSPDTGLAPAGTLPADENAKAKNRRKQRAANWMSSAKKNITYNDLQLYYLQMALQNGSQGLCKACKTNFLL
jgi:hypothetical protein